MLTFGFFVIRKGPVTVQCDTDDTAIRGLELFTVDLDGVRVREDDTVSDTIQAVYF